MSSAAVVAEALKVRQTVLAEKVKAGDITQAQADAAIADHEDASDRARRHRERLAVTAPAAAWVAAAVAGGAWSGLRRELHGATAQ